MINNNQPILDVDRNGSQYWRLNGEYHREDGPAIIYPDESEYWFLNGYLHRDDGPAIEYKNGTKYWYQYGKKHRVDGPAIISYKGTKYWCLNNIEFSYEKWFSELTLDQQHNYLWNLDNDF